MISYNVIFPIFTTTVSFLFFLSVSEQYIRKRKPHQLVWAVSMFLFFITAGMEGFSMLIGKWIPLIYRIYYLFAAIQVSLMGAGLLYLFTTRNIINERNSAKAVFIFNSIWVLFSYMFLSRSNIFLAVLIPSSILVLGSLLYFLVNTVDKIKYRKQVPVMLCTMCRNVFDHPKIDCSICSSEKVVLTNQSSTFTNFWHARFKSNNFAHYFLIFVIYLFLLMNLYVWTLPLNNEWLASKSGQEVSGLAWQTDPGINDFSSRALIRLFSPLHTVPGAIALIGGGIYSYTSWQLSIKRYSGKFEPSKGMFNLYIAFGAWVLGLGATASGFGIGTLYISEVISVTFMYYGFLESDKLSKEKIKKALDISWIWKRHTQSEMLGD